LFVNPYGEEPVFVVETPKQFVYRYVKFVEYVVVAIYAAFVYVCEPEQS
jgi:hypothetical protein